MSYYRTLREDVERAKEILERGKGDPAGLLAHFPDAETRQRVQELIGGTIYGADIYAAYKLLESFVEVITTMDVKVCETAMRARKRGEELAAAEAAAQASGHPHITCPKCGMTSYNANDIRERYCGNCHQFHDHMEERR